MHSIVWEVSLLFGKGVLSTFCQSLRVLVGLLPTRYGYILKMRGISVGTLCSKLTFLVGLGKTLLIQMQLARKFFLYWVFHRCLLRSSGHGLRSGSWHPAWGRIGARWLVVGESIRLLPLALRWSLYSCQVILLLLWSACLLSRVLKNQAFFLKASECSCDNNWRSRCNFVLVSSILKISHLLGLFGFCGLGGYSLRCDSSPEKFDLSNSKTAFFDS